MYLNMSCKGFNSSLTGDSMFELNYGNTNTYFIQGEKSGLLVDTDYAGTMSAFPNP